MNMYKHIYLFSNRSSIIIYFVRTVLFKEYSCLCIFQGSKGDIGEAGIPGVDGISVSMNQQRVSDSSF